MTESPRRCHKAHEEHAEQILDIATAIFAIFQLACALAPNITSLLIFRLIAGLGGSACLSIGGGIISDLFESSERGIATAVWALGPLLGPVLGPIIGGFLSQKAGWRWVIEFRYWKVQFFRSNKYL